jgi:hypothetical protein
MKEAFLSKDERKNIPKQEGSLPEQRPTKDGLQAGRRTFKTPAKNANVLQSPKGF